MKNKNINRFILAALVSILVFVWSLISLIISCASSNQTAEKISLSVLLVSIACMIGCCVVIYTNYPKKK